MGLDLQGRGVISSAGVPDPFVVPDGDWNITGDLSVSGDVNVGGQVLAGDGAVGTSAYGFTSMAGAGMYWTGAALILAQSSQNRILISNSTMNYSSRLTTQANFAGHTLVSSLTLVATTGEQRGVDAIATFAPATGDATFAGMLIAQTINQTGGATGNTVGLRVATTGTALGGTHNLLELQYHATAPVNVFSVDSAGQCLGVYGDTTKPTYGFASSPNTGLSYRDGTNLELIVSGINRLQITAPATILKSNLTSNINTTGIILDNRMDITSTSGTTAAVGLTTTFAPSSGSADFRALVIDPTINQTATATGDYTALFIDVTETAFLGTNAYLAQWKVGGSDIFVVDTAGDVYIAGTQVLTSRQIDAAIDDTINSGDATTDGVIAACRNALIAHGLVAAA